MGIIRIPNQWGGVHRLAPMGGPIVSPKFPIHQFISIHHLPSIIWNHQIIDELMRDVFKTTFGAKQASNTGPVPPREQQSTSNKLSDCRLDPMRRSDWSDQPESTGSSRINWFNCRRLTAQPPGNRQQQQVVENQVSNWPTRYMVLGGFTPGTPVSTSFFLKREKKRSKKIKRKD